MSMESNSLRKTKSLNSNSEQLTSPVPTIGSMFNPVKQSSIGDLHHNEDAHHRQQIAVPSYNTDALLSKFESETKTLSEICTNYSSMQETFGKVIREQSACIQELVKELERKNSEIQELKARLSAQSNTNENTNTNTNAVAVSKHHSYMRPQPPINGNARAHNHQALTVDEHNMNNLSHHLYSNGGMNGHASHNNVTRNFHHSATIMVALHEDGTHNSDHTEEYEQILGHVPIL